MPMGEDDLINLRDKVREKLDELKDGIPIVINHKNAQNLYNSSTGGWWANIGRLSRPQTGLEQCTFRIFLDKEYHKNHKISYFIETRNLDIMYELLNRIRYEKLFGPTIRTINEKDWNRNPLQLIDIFTEEDFNEPFLDFWPLSNEFYYGKCDSSNHISDTLVERIVSFYINIGKALPPKLKVKKPIPPKLKIKKPKVTKPERNNTYPRVENRKIVKEHTTRERNPILSLQRKRRDGYQCQICKMKFEKVYGEIGRNFAEAHHIIPLAKLETTQLNTIEDLITVCANCHRMLHKLNGEKGDIKKLKKRISEEYLDAIYEINEE
jgi:5-methylcytosine-specific restriction endonuclease McrA